MRISILILGFKGLREASKKIPDDDEFCAKTKSQEGFIKYSTGLYWVLNRLIVAYCGTCSHLLCILFVAFPFLVFGPSP